MTDIASAGYKRCMKCGEVKSFEEFSRNNRRKDGLCVNCKACDKKAKKAWREANPGRSTAESRAWREANPERSTAASRAWYEANPERSAAKSRAWREANPENIAAYQRAWYEANADKAKANRHHYRARKADVESSFTADELKLLQATQGGFCAYCQRAATLQIDHILPMKRGGPNTAANICLACERCNLDKGDKTLDEWSEKGRWYWRD